jgi:[ribosomal protein S18]-alanine N-acetyltransferase
VTVEIDLARLADATTIAVMSRDYIESGLGWSWTVPRVRRSIRDQTTNVIVARERERGAISGFAIMSYQDERAHLLLLAVRPRSRRQGIGSALMAWLDETAHVAGIGAIELEVRANNLDARLFYRHFGFVERETLSGYYSGVEPAIRMERNLRKVGPMWPMLRSPGSH